MTIDKVQNGSSVILEVEGRLETTTAPELETVIKNELDGVSELTFDFSKLEYISSAGLRVILSAQKIMGGKGTLKVIGVNEIVKEVFDITGFSDIITVE
ncbi:MAG: STAS domain-containing protein [Eubacterium sp.]|nr:STAS domain-containing protein [Eubacterium sp.]